MGEIRYDHENVHSIAAALRDQADQMRRDVADHAEPGVTDGWIHEVGAVGLGPRHATALAVVAGAGTAEAKLAAAAAEAGNARPEAVAAAAPWIARTLGERA